MTLYGHGSLGFEHQRHLKVNIKAKKKRRNSETRVYNQKISLFAQIVAGVYCCEQNVVLNKKKRMQKTFDKLK